MVSISSQKMLLKWHLLAKAGGRTRSVLRTQASAPLFSGGCQRLLGEQRERQVRSMSLFHLEEGKVLCWESGQGRGDVPCPGFPTNFS